MNAAARPKHRKTKTKSRILSHNQSLQIAYVHLRSTAYNLDSNVCVRRPKPHQYWLPGPVVLTDKKNMHTKNKPIVKAATSPQGKKPGAHQCSREARQIRPESGNNTLTQNLSFFRQQKRQLQLKRTYSESSRKAASRRHTRVDCWCAQERSLSSRRSYPLRAAWASCPSPGSERQFQEADQGTGLKGPTPGPVPVPLSCCKIIATNRHLATSRVFFN